MPVINESSALAGEPRKLRQADLASEEEDR
jgi:hypothetical protein